MSESQPYSSEREGAVEDGNDIDKIGRNKEGAVRERGRSIARKYD